MMRRLGLLLAAIFLVACTSPLEIQPAPTPPNATPPLADATVAPPPTTAALAPPGQPRPTIIPQPGVPPGPDEALADPARLAAATPQVRDQVELAEAFKHIGDIPKVARTAPFDVQVGDLQSFW